MSRKFENEWFEWVDGTILKFEEVIGVTYSIKSNIYTAVMKNSEKIYMNAAEFNSFKEKLKNKYNKD